MSDTSREGGKASQTGEVNNLVSGGRILASEFSLSPCHVSVIFSLEGLLTKEL